MLTFLMKLGFICSSSFFFFYDYLEKRAAETTRSGNIAAKIKMYLKGLNERRGQSIKVARCEEEKEKKEREGRKRGRT